MGQVKFLIKKKKGLASVYVRFYGTGFDFSTSTGLKVYPEHWSSAKQMFKNVVQSNEEESETDKDQANRILKALKDGIPDKYNVGLINGELLNKDWFKKTVKGIVNPQSIVSKSDINLIEYFEIYIENLPTRLIDDDSRPFNKRSIDRYKVVLKNFKKYEEHLNSNRKEYIHIKLNSIDLAFREDFIRFQRIDNKYSLATIRKDITVLKSVLSRAEFENYSVNPIYKDSKRFKRPKESESDKVKEVYLNESEIEKILNLDLSHSERLDNARNWLIVGVWTGLRISDLMRLNSSMIEKDNIKITTVKTDSKVTIPVHDNVKEILDKNGGDFPRKLSDQVFNRYIKEVCKLAGIVELKEGKLMNPVTKRKEIGMYPKYELISSHSCRRSFATNHHGKMDMETIMAITSHKTESAYRTYLKMDQEEYSKKLADYWKNKKNEQIS